jgi:cellobiose-specific phosphotransferase system component IIB
MKPRVADEKLVYNPIIKDTDEPPIEYFTLDKRLNRRQHLFIWNAVNNPRESLIEAASKAGYKDPRQQANKLMMNPLVRSEYHHLMNEVKKKSCAEQNLEKYKYTDPPSKNGCAVGYSGTACRILPFNQN